MKPVGFFSFVRNTLIYAVFTFTMFFVHNGIILKNFTTIIDGRKNIPTSEMMTSGDIIGGILTVFVFFIIHIYNLKHYTGIQKSALISDIFKSKHKQEYTSLLLTGIAIGGLSLFSVNEISLFGVVGYFQDQIGIGSGKAAMLFIFPPLQGLLLTIALPFVYREDMNRIANRNARINDANQTALALQRQVESDRERAQRENELRKRLELDFEHYKLRKEIDVRTQNEIEAIRSKYAVVTAEMLQETDARRSKVLQEQADLYRNEVSKWMKLLNE